MNCKLNLYQNEYVKTEEQPLFFGCARNTQRYDKVKYEFYDKLNQDMKDLFWIPSEVSLISDKADFHNLDKVQKHIFTTVISKLVMLDSLQGRSPILMFGQITTNPEFENSLNIIQFFEGAIHSFSYSYMVEFMMSENPELIFDDSWKNQELRSETDTIIREYNNLYECVIEYVYKNQKGIPISNEWLEEFKEKIFLAMISINILEGIRFYSGFASVWSITEFSNRLAGSSRILQLISRDENKHLAFTQKTIQILKRDKNFKGIFEKITSKIYDMYWEASEEEMRWIDELYKYGSPMGINSDIAKTYIKFLTNVRLKAIGLKSIYPEVKENPLKWIGKYLNYGSSEKSLQESEEIDYLLNPIKHDKLDLDYIKNV